MCLKSAATFSSIFEKNGESRTYASPCDIRVRGPVDALEEICVNLLHRWRTDKQAIANLGKWMNILEKWQLSVKSIIEWIICKS